MARRVTHTVQMYGCHKSEAREQRLAKTGTQKKITVNTEDFSQVFRNIHTRYSETAITQGSTEWQMQEKY